MLPPASGVPATTTQRVKIFEVEAVVEDHPDSPETVSDLSADGSTDNLAGEEKPSQPSNVNDPKRFPEYSAVSCGGLESKSDSHIAGEFGMALLTEPGSQDSPVCQNIPGDNPPLTMQQKLDGMGLKTDVKQHSYVLPQPVERQRPSNDPRVPTHYCTTSALDSSLYPQRAGITEQTFLPYRRNNSYSVMPNLAQPEVDDSAAADPRPFPSQYSPTIDDLPNASLLSEAFMRFLHSMSLVFRDPTFHPLIDSLDHKFNPLLQQAQPTNFVYPTAETVPPSAYPPEQYHEPGGGESNTIPPELQASLQKYVQDHLYRFYCTVPYTVHEIFKTNVSFGNHTLSEFELS